MKSIRFVRFIFSIRFAHAKLLLIVFLMSLPSSMAAGEPKLKLILDADTANEIDDQYAIIRMLKQDKFDVIGLNSAQWFHYLGDSESVQASQELNEKLIELMNVTDVPTNLGAERPMGKPWGGDDAKDSAAAQFIIKSARELPADEKLFVVCLGASTNLASAIKMAPEISPRIKAYLMAFKYDFKTKAWDKSEFNVRRDLNAADFLLNQKDLELHVMSATTSKVFTFDRLGSFEKQSKMGPLGKQLTDRWTKYFPTSENWVMWDLALVEAMIDPSLASEEQVLTPPENFQREVWMYKTIEVGKMRDDFWKSALGQ